MNFAHTSGPLALAIPIWRNSLVFHSLDKVRGTGRGTGRGRGRARGRGRGRGRGKVRVASPEP